MCCPECLSTDLTIHIADFGTCAETGYHDASEMFECLTCGATGDADELVEELPAKIAPQSETARPAAMPISA